MTRPRLALRPGIVGWLLLLLAVGFVGAALAGSWQDVRASVAQLSMASVVVSGSAAAVGMLLTGLSWRAVLAGLGVRLPRRRALTLFCTAQLGKYVPGSVWVVAMQADLGRRWGIPAGLMTVSYLLATTVAIGTGAVMAVLSVVDPQLPVAPVVLVVTAVAGLALLLGFAHPQTINRITAALARVLRRELPAFTMSPGWLARAVVLECLGWIALGLHIWLLALPLGATAGSAPVAIGAFALAFVAGLVLIPLPAGLGVREGLLVALLTPSLGATAALTVALVSRLVLVVVDIVLAVLTGSVSLLRRSRAVTASAADSDPGQE